MLSIIIPVYNVEQYLSKCIKSILEQSYQNLEIILINDGSTDNSLCICQEFAKKDARIKIFSKKNEGVSKARNFGLKKSSGNYIMFVDSDDWLEENICEKCMKILKKNDIDMLLFDMCKVFSNQKRNFYLFDENQERINKEILVYNLVVQKNGNNQALFGPYCKIFKSEKIKGLFFHSRIFYAEDTLFVLSVLDKMKRISYIHECGYYYRQIFNNSLSSKYLPQFNFNFIRLVKEYEKKLKDNKKLFRYYKISRFLNLVCFYGIRGMGIDSFWTRWKKVKIAQKIIFEEKEIFEKSLTKYLTNRENVMYTLMKFKGTFLIFLYYNLKQLVKLILKYKGKRV